MRDAAARKGFAEPDVLLRWPEIIGEHLAQHCRPVRVKYPTSRRLGATLVVQATGARAPEIEHLAPRIIERVNRFYGYRAVTRLSLTQSTGHVGISGFAEPAAGFAGPPPRAPGEPTTDELERAAPLAQDIQDPGLKAALTRLAANVLARDSASEIAAGRHMTPERKRR